MNNKLQVVCAWCQKVIGEKEGITKISHGICEECKEGFKEKLNKEEEKAYKTINKWEKQSRMNQNLWFVLVLGSLLCGYFVLKGIIGGC